MLVRAERMDSMKRFTIAKNPEQAATEFVAQYEEVRPQLEFSMIPKSIGSDEKFWAKIVELKPEFISRVPDVIRNSEAFAKLIDHQLFYNYIPKKFLTAEDFEIHKNSSKRSACGYGSPAQISEHNCFDWVTYDHGNYPWYDVSTVTAESIFSKISEINPAKNILPELWSQKLADLIWDSPLALVSYNAIPEEFVRKEWDELTDFFSTKRYPIFKYGTTLDHPENLVEYWGQFKTEEDMKMAFQVEELIERCSNPYGYAVNINPRYLPNFEEDVEHYEALWKTIEPMTEKNPEFVEEFFKIYDRKLSPFIPIEKFNFDWIKDSNLFKFYLTSYKEAVEGIDLAESEVEKLEAQDDMNKAIKGLKEAVLKYCNITDAEAEAFIAPYIQTIE